MEHKSKMEIRHVAFHKTRGIFISDGAGGTEFWSAENPVGDVATTFTAEEFDRRFGGVPDVERKEVWPDKHGFKASIEAIANVGLPIWKP